MGMGNFRSALTLFLAIVLITLTACQGSGGSPSPTSLTFQPLELDGEAHSGNLSEGEANYFSFTATAGETYTVFLETQSGDTDLVVASDANGDQVIGSSGNYGTSVDLVTFVAATTQTYYLQVFAYSTSGYSVSVITGAPNFPPTISSLTVIPNQPRTNDDLVLSYSATDPEGDPLTETITWLKNGEILNGENTATLASSNFQKGDTISVHLTVSDGSYNPSRNLDVLIADSPPQLNVVPPSAVTAGSTISLPINVVDPDGDPFTYEFLYGPTGMMLNTDGSLNWTADQGGYFQEYDVNWAVRVQSGGTSIDYTNTLRVTNPDRSEPMVRNGIEIPTRNNSFDVGDFDQDGKMELLVTDNGHRLYTMEFDGTNYVQNWVYPFDIAPGQTIGAIKAKDINGDGRKEFVVGIGSSYSSSSPNAGIRIIDGAAHQVITETDVTGSNILAVDVVDMDQDGTQEIVALIATDSSYYSNSRILVLDAATLTSEWDSGVEAFGTSMAIGNFDTSPTLEIATSNGYVYGLVGGTYVNRWLSSGFGSHVAAGDLDGDGVDEIIGTNVDISAYSLVTKNLLWSLTGTTSYLSNQALHVANIDGDPEDEIIVGESQWGDIASISYDLTTDTLIEDWRTSSQNHGVSSIISADLDNDGAIEVAWASGATSSGANSLVAAGFNPGISVEWANLTTYPVSSTDIPQLDGPFVGGYWFNAQTAQPRALFATGNTNNGYSGARFITVDAASETIQISPEIGTNWNNALALNVADFDSDGTDEIFTATSDYYDGYFTVYDFMTDSFDWNSPINQGVGRAVATGDLNGDGAPDFAVATADGYIRAYDILNQTLIWSNGGTPASAQDVEIADVDGDGTMEIIAAVDNSVVIFEESTGGYTQRNAVTFSDVTDIAISDLDGNGKLEIAAAVTGTYYGNGQVILFDSNLTQLSSFTTATTLRAVFFDAPSSDVKLILAFGDDYFYSEAPNYLSWIDPMTGNEIYRSPSLLGTVQKNSLHIADTNGNGHNELIFGTSQAMYITQ